MHRNANLCPPIVIEEDSYQLGYGIDHRNLGNKAEHLSPLLCKQLGVLNISIITHRRCGSPVHRHDTTLELPIHYRGVGHSNGDVVLLGNCGNFDLLTLDSPLNAPLVEIP